MVGFFRIIFLIVMLVGNLGDAISTYQCTRVLGVQSERNPIVRGLMEVLGVIPAMVLKVLLFSGLAIWVCSSVVWWANLVMGIPYCWVTVHNFKVVAKAKESQ